MLLKDNKKNRVTIIMKKLQGGSDSSPSFSKDSMYSAPMPEGAQVETTHAEDACCEDMISAFEMKDAKKLKAALKSFVQMMIQEEEAKEESEY